MTPRQTDKPKSYHLGIRVDEDTMNALDTLAGKARRKTSEYARLVLEDHISEKRKKKEL